MKVLMRHDNGIEKKIKQGFSWTTLFFAWIPSLLRGDIISAIKLFIMGFITFGIYPAYKSFTINRDYKEFMTVRGYKEIEILDEGVPQMKILEWIAVILKIVLVPLILGSVFTASSIMMNDMMQNSENMLNMPLPNGTFTQESITNYTTN